jgi:3-hydroxyisobutyrate dehydrogenase-like beta-hydroxyacid dehydrogenase
MMTNATRLGFIGLGSMGSAMATRLLEAGYAVAVFDTNPAALQPLASNGAVVANDVAAVASEADIILGSLPTPDVVREVAIGPGGII